MNKDDVFSRLNTLTGSFGLLVQTNDSREVIAYHADEWFPLASTAKVALGALVASMVADGNLSWNLPLQGVHLDPSEDSAILYPHLQGMSELPLHHVVEIMIASHDQHCADALADMLGGWAATRDHVGKRFEGIRIHPDPRDEDSNVGKLRSMVDVVEYVLRGYRENPNVFEPVTAGLVRMADKTPGIPTHHQWNMTGGLPHSFMDIGVLGNPSANSYLLYAIAGRNVEDRQVSREADDFAADVIRDFYDAWKEGKS